jgi:hypothetical protein
MYESSYPARVPFCPGGLRKLRQFHLYVYFMPLLIDHHLPPGDQLLANCFFF